MSNDGGITGPEGVLMLMVAAVLDGIGLIILFFALDDFGALEIIAGGILGIWILLRNSDGMPSISSIVEYGKNMANKTKSSANKSPPQTSKTGGDIGGMTKGLLKKFGLTFLIELIPWLGGLIPGYTIFVWKEMGGMAIPSGGQEETAKNAGEQGTSGQSKVGGGEIVPAEIANKNQTKSNSNQETPKTAA